MATWKIVIIVYLLSGLIVIASPKVRKEILDTASAEERTEHPAWKIAALYVIVIIFAAVFWPIFLEAWFRKEGSVLSQLQKSPGTSQLKELFDLMNELSADGCDTDEIPGGRGEFGFELTNPVPTNTALGSISYLGKLRTADGEKVQYERIGSFLSSVSEKPVDGYQLTDQNNGKIGVVYVSPYHKRNSEKAPHGLRILT